MEEAIASYNTMQHVDIDPNHPMAQPSFLNSERTSPTSPDEFAPYWCPEPTMLLPESMKMEQEQHDFSQEDMLNLKRESDLEEEDTDSLVKPKRPLNAYNIFFRHERAKLLLSAENGETPTLRHVSNEENNDSDCTKAMEKLNRESIREVLAKNPYKTESRKRPHRKTHGKVGFSDLAKHIAESWKSVDQETRALFIELAAEDKERYRREIEVYKKKLAQQKSAEALKAKSKMMRKRKAQSLMEASSELGLYQNILKKARLADTLMGRGQQNGDLSFMQHDSGFTGRRQSTLLDLLEGALNLSAAGNDNVKTDSSSFFPSSPQYAKTDLSAAYGTRALISRILQCLESAPVPTSNSGNAHGSISSSRNDQSSSFMGQSRDFTKLDNGGWGSQQDVIPSRSQQYQQQQQTYSEPNELKSFLSECDWSKLE